MESGEPTATPEDAVVRFSLLRPPFWTPAFTMTFLAVTTVAAAYFLTAQSQFPAAPWFVHVLVPLGCCLVALLARKVMRPAEVPPLSFFEDHMLVPRSAESGRLEKIGYGDIVSVDLRGRGPAERLFIGTRQALLVYPRPAFADPEAVERLLKELYARILRLPNGKRIVDEIARRRKIALAALSSSPAATQGILTTMAMVFGMQYLGGALETPVGVARFGAIGTALVRQGEVHRLFSSIAVHGDVMQLYFELLALYFLGSILERLLGQARFCLIFFISALTSGLVFVATRADLFLYGAAGGIFGSFGALAVVSLRYRGELPVGFRQRPIFWVPVTLLLLLLPFVTPAVHSVVQLSGLVAGAVTTLLVLDGSRSLDPSVPAPLGLRLPASVLSVMFAISTVVAVAWALRRDSAADRAVARAVISDPTALPHELNALAWGYAVARKSADPELALAEQAADRALALAPDEPSITDTLAGVLFRRGQLERALPLQTRALSLEQRPQYAIFFAAHLGQMLDQRLDEGGVLVPAGVGPVRLTLQPPADGVAHGVVEVDGAHSGVTVYAVGRAETVAVGLVRVRIPAGVGRAELVLRDATWPAAAAFAVGLVEVGCDGCTASVADAYGIDDTLRDLPELAEASAQR